MLLNNWKLAFRKLWRNRRFTFINLLGLSLGMAVFFIIAEYVMSEWNTNRFNTSFNHAYRINIQYKEGNTDPFITPGLAPLIKEKVAGIKKIVRVADGLGNGVVSVAGDPSGRNSVFRENAISYADSDFLQVFTFPLIAGNATLTTTSSAALSQSMSIKLFGNKNPIGKVISVSNQFGNGLFTVTALFNDMSGQSDIQASVLLPIQRLENKGNRDGNDWADPNTLESGFTQQYAVLDDHTNPEAVQTAMTQLLRQNKNNSLHDRVLLQPFSGLHLAPSFTSPFQTYGSLLQVIIFSAIALLILIIAWFNYINLSTAMALRNAGEVGMKKILGASRWQIAVQFLFQTFILSVISILLAVLLVYQCQPFFNAFLGKTLSLSVLCTRQFLMTGASLLLLTAFFSGSYVAFILSSFTPAKILRGDSGKIFKGITLKKVLVVFQFSISVVLIIGTIVLYRQLHYMQNSALGMKLDQLLVIKGPTVSSEGQAARNESFKQNLSSLSFVQKIAASNNVPGQGYNFQADGITGLHPQKGDERKSYAIFICDPNFFDTYGIQFAEGKSFSASEAAAGWTKSKKVILNESAARALGFDLTKPLTGEKILWGSSYEIAGIVKDYHHLSLKESIKPVIYLGSSSFGYFTLKTNAAAMQQKLAQIKTLYQQYFPGNPFEYNFADEAFGLQYAAEQKLNALLVVAAAIAIFIACLGLFGLASFSIQQRLKEIGIRKVLGAGLRDIAFLITRDFVKLICWAILLAIPFAYWGAHSWLQDFAYRTQLSWWLFALAASITLFVAVITIGAQALHAARKNPVKNLRTDS